MEIPGKSENDGPVHGVKALYEDRLVFVDKKGFEREMK